MTDSIMYRGDYFVLLTPDNPERFLTADELFALLKETLQRHPDITPRELDKFPDPDEKIIHLRDNYCELDTGDGGFLEWYLVRLEK